MTSRAKNKRMEVAGLLQSAILNGDLKLGERLRELKLASQFGVSQAAVREALQQLEGLGLVVKYPNRGSYVVNLESADLIHIYQVRRELDPLACALAAVGIRQQTLDLLEEQIARMREASRKRDHQAYLTADLGFHRSIWQSQPNPYLEKVLTGLCLPLFAYELVRRQDNLDLDFDRAIRRHGMILATLKTGDPVFVTKIIRRVTDRFLRQDLADYSHARGSPEISLADAKLPTSSVSQLCCLEPGIH